MHEYEEPGRQAYLSRGDVELELARIALVVMRVSPQGFSELGSMASDADGDSLPSMCTRLLRRTAPEHRPFVEDRLLELARSLAGGRVDAGREWLDVTFDLGPAPASELRLRR
jgi:hypothetical protein